MSAWERFALAARLLAADPSGLGGMVLRARAGPVRERAIVALGAVPLPERRVHPGIGDDALYGGTDLAATLASGAVVEAAGMLAVPACLVVPMAERMPAGLAARLAGAVEAGHCVVALDEGDRPEERVPGALADRLAFPVDLDGIAWSETDAEPVTRPGGAALADGAAIRELATLGEMFGVAGPRAILLALRAARVHAALAGRGLAEGDLAVAAELVLAPRATRVPELAAEDAPPEEEAPREDTGSGPLPDEALVEAVRALLPPDLLARVAAARAGRLARGNGAGAKRRANRRGRPLAARPGRLGDGARVDLVATLRAAAPWQRLRAASAVTRRTVHIRPSDIRLRRFEARSDRLLVFAVDASGSSAFARLGEAKGAVELLLAEAYARRDHVALVAFRGTGAEVLLPPTRSLVQTKRRLAALPGGGATPLAAGLRAALGVAAAGAARGMTPTLVLLTDGRANVALDGAIDRAAAAADALALARTARTGALVIDTGARPERALATLAAALGAPYVPLPKADARRLSAAIGAALEREAR